MFTLAEFEQLLDAQDDTVLETCPYYVTCPQYAFTTPDAEEFIRITRAPRSVVAIACASAWKASFWMIGAIGNPVCLII
jgi:hypothetical protein